MGRRIFSPNQDDLSYSTQIIFPGSTKLGKARQTLPQKLSNWVDVITVRSPFSSSITPPWGKPSNLWTPCVYSLRPRFPSWIWIRWIQSASHRNNSKSPSTLAMSTAMKISLRQPAISSLGNIFWRHSRFSPQTTRTTHSWATTSFLSLTSKHDFRYTMATVSHSHIQQCLKQTMHFSPRHLAAKMPSKVYNNFLPSFLPSFLRDLQHKRKPFISCCH